MLRIKHNFETKGQTRFNKVASIPLVLLILMGGVPAYAASPAPVSLGAAGSFAVLANTTITNTGSTVINGDLGLSPGTSVTGFPPGTVNGTQHVTDATAASAQTDLTSAYTDAAGRSPTGTISADLGGQTLTSGVYKDNGAPASLSITGTLTLNAAGDPNAVFIFQSASTLTTAASSVVSLINGAQACNVFWQVGSSATLGTSSTFKGNILALTSATLNTGANVEGRVLARNGAVTLGANTITKATCASPPPPPPPPPVPVYPPYISIVKVPNPLALPSGPGSVAYTYTVTNIGTVPLSNVTVTDNKCAPVIFLSGDTNSNSILETYETWTYGCTTTVSQTTQNTATATGYYRGQIAIDTAVATVVVSVPLPPPLIHVTKTPDHFLLPFGGGLVTYTYAVTNPGVVPLSNVSVADDKCRPVFGGSGDINGNKLLDTNETWVFSCLSEIAGTTVNRVTAEGSANGLTAIDYAIATVVVAPKPKAPHVTPKLPNTGIGSDGKSVPWNIFIPIGVLASLFLFGVTRKKRIN